MHCAAAGYVRASNVLSRHTSHRPGVGCTLSSVPNGRSGGFLIESAVLKQFVQASSDDAVIGRLSTGSSFRDVRAAEITGLLVERPQERLAVEEQDHVAYIVHISDEPDIVWLLVTPKSPLFAELRRRHAQWAADHPGWNGWIGF